MANRSVIYAVMALLLVFSSVAFFWDTMEVENVKGTQLGRDVYQNFKSANVMVSPETAESITGIYSQTVTFTNTHEAPVFVWFDSFFDENLKRVKIERLDEVVRQVPNIVRECSTSVQSVNGSDANVKTCSDVQQGVKNVVSYAPSPMETTLKGWGGSDHFHTTSGILVGIGSSQLFRITYEPFDNSGKWNARFWASEINDAQCIVSEDCLYDYTIDPAWAGNIPSLDVCYTMDDADVNVTTVFDEFTGVYNGTRENGVVSGAPGKNLQSLRFDGTDDFLNTSYGVGEFALHDAFNFFMWINTTDNGTTTRIPFGTGVSEFFELQGAGANRQIAFYFSDNAGARDNGVRCIGAWSNISDSLFHGVGISSRGGAPGPNILTVWMDGINITGGCDYPWITGDDPGNTSLSTDIGFGGRSAGASPFGGSIDEPLFAKTETYSQAIVDEWHNTAFACPFVISQAGELNSSLSFPTPVFETSLNQFNVSFTFDNNTIMNVTTANFTYNGSSDTGIILSANSTFITYHFNRTAPIVGVNATNLAFSWAYNVTFQNGTSNISTTGSSQRVDWAFFGTNISTIPVIAEGTAQSIGHNVSRQISSAVTIASILQYNNVNLTINTTPENFSTFFLFNHAQTTPIVVENATFNITSWINISDGTHSAMRRLQGNNQSQVVTPFNLNNCTVAGTVIANFTLLNETSNALVVGDVDGYFTTVNLVSDITKNFNITWTGNSFYELCMDPAGQQFNTTAQIEYSATGFSEKTFFINNQVLNGSPVIPYDLFLTDGTSQVTLNVKDENDNPVAGAFISVLTYDIATDSSTTTEIVQTDFNGNAFAQMILNTQWYRFIIVLNGDIILETTETKLLTNTLNFRVNLGSDYFVNYDKVQGIACDLTFTNATTTFSYTFNNPTGASVNASLSVTRMDAFGSEVINLSSVVGSSGNLNLNIGGAENKTYTGTGTVLIDGNTFVCGTPVSVSFGGDWQQFGLDGIFVTFLVVLTLALIGIWSPSVSIGLATVGFLISIIMGVFHLSWALVSVVVILGGIALYRANRT